MNLQTVPHVASFRASQDRQVDANGMARAIPAVAARIRTDPGWRWLELKSLTITIYDHLFIIMILSIIIYYDIIYYHLLLDYLLSSIMMMDYHSSSFVI